ncbi:uncharacterized protein LOC108733655 [Agrilus planipennis]|uniref:Uncharacterized protein LOC108733655 n=1 Tax=Agrilus planipennis TaxID=224129 RepID=A0A1W4WJW4_AGRPL|nr:uncharacterized protein LOC108733655 [Agrilus planipennis]
MVLQITRETEMVTIQESEEEMVDLLVHHMEPHQMEEEIMEMVIMEGRLHLPTENLEEGKMVMVMVMAMAMEEEECQELLTELLMAVKMVSVDCMVHHEMVTEAMVFMVARMALMVVHQVQLMDHLPMEMEEMEDLLNPTGHQVKMETVGDMEKKNQQNTSFLMKLMIQKVVLNSVTVNQGMVTLQLVNIMCCYQMVENR